MTLEPDLNSLPSQLVVSAKDPDRFIKSVFRQESSQAFSLIETHYKLTGPKNCSAAKLQSIIFDVAHILVREDAMPLGLACAWFNENNLQVSSEHCSPLEPLKKHLGIKFDYVKTKPRDGECLDVR
jgi:hypothetical protein